MAIQNKNHTWYASLENTILKRSAEMPRRFLSSFEAMRRDNGAFIAAPHAHYEACWIRDHLYCTLAYYYTGDILRFSEGVRVIFQIFHNYRVKIESELHGFPHVHAKFEPETLKEFEYNWGHHQLDAIGLFLFIVALAHKDGIRIAANHADKELLQLLIFYLTAFRYWEMPDNGMWEEGLDVHSSSVGAVVAGLRDIQETRLAHVPNVLIGFGKAKLDALLPDECPLERRHVDMAQLSLIWPYNVVAPGIRDEILCRVEMMLAQTHGLNRYWGDEYYCSDNGVSAEWPMGFFWLAIIYATLDDIAKSRLWFDRGLATVTANEHIPEAYQNGKPNEHSPLAWAHAMAMIAAVLLAKIESAKK